MLNSIEKTPKSAEAHIKSSKIINTRVLGGLGWGDQLPIPTRYKLSAKSRGVPLKFWPGPSPPPPRAHVHMLIKPFSPL